MSRCAHSGPFFDDYSSKAFGPTKAAAPWECPWEGRKRNGSGWACPRSALCCSRPPLPPVLSPVFLPPRGNNFRRRSRSTSSLGGRGNCSVITCGGGGGTDNSFGPLPCSALEEGIGCANPPLMPNCCPTIPKLPRAIYWGELCHRRENGKGAKPSISLRIKIFLRRQEQTQNGLSNF